MAEVLMPRLSDTMEEGTILAWLIGDGETVAAGDEIVEIETDKANMNFEAEEGGVLRIVAASGETLPVGQVMAEIGDGSAPARASATPTAEPEASAEPTPAAGSDGAGDGHVRATPLARRVARELGLELHTVTGSGPRGRIVRDDVTKAAAGVQTPATAIAATPQPRVPASVTTTGEVTTAKGEVTRVELSNLQRVVARRMAEAKATVPEFQVGIEVDMTAAFAFRAQLKEIATEERPAPSVNDFILKACGLALREFPRANGSYRDDGLDLHSRVNIGVAVAGDDSLVVPTVFDVDQKSLGAIGGETRRLAGRVRSGEVTPPELAGATFTVSNLGMFGVNTMTPVINTPQAAILGVSAAREVLARRDGALVDLRVMQLTLTCDHRILYGADAARFLARIRDLLESPLSLTL